MPKNLDKQILKLFQPARRVKLTPADRLLMSVNFKLTLWSRQWREFITLPAKTPRFLLAVAASLVLLLAVGGGVWAIERSQPGNFLYPAKQKLNQVVAKVVPLSNPVAESPEPAAEESPTAELPVSQPMVKPSAVESPQSKPAIELPEAASDQAKSAVENAAKPAENAADQVVEKVKEVLPNLGL